MDVSKIDSEKLRDTLNVSLKILETAGDPIVVGEAKKIEGIVDQMLAIKNSGKIDATLSDVAEHIENVKKFDQSVVSKYGLVAARVIEFGLVALIAVKYLYLQ